MLILPPSPHGLHFRHALGIRNRPLDHLFQLERLGIGLSGQYISTLATDWSNPSQTLADFRHHFISDHPSAALDVIPLPSGPLFVFSSFPHNHAFG